MPDIDPSHPYPSPVELAVEPGKYTTYTSLETIKSIQSARTKHFRNTATLPQAGDAALWWLEGLSRFADSDKPVREVAERALYWQGAICRAAARSGLAGPAAETATQSLAQFEQALERTQGHWNESTGFAWGPPGLVHYHLPVVQRRTTSLTVQSRTKQPLLDRPFWTAAVISA